MTHVAGKSKLRTVVRSSMQPCPGNWVAIGASSRAFCLGCRQNLVQELNVCTVPNQLPYWFYASSKCQQYHFFPNFEKLFEAYVNEGEHQYQSRNYFWIVNVLIEKYVKYNLLTKGSRHKSIYIIDTNGQRVRRRTNTA